MLENLLLKINLPRRDIYGCDAYGADSDKQSLYLRRFFLWRSETFGNLYLHFFHRSDDDRNTLHDHPWAFVSLLLKGGYTEHTPEGAARKLPGMILYRPANWIHRVELTHGRCVSLVWVGKRVRTWGFWEGGRFTAFFDYFRAKGCD